MTGLYLQISICLCTVLTIASGGPLWHEYLNATDWVISDVYPVANVDFPVADRTVATVYETMKTYNEFDPPSGAVLPPVIVVPNAFGGGEVWPREPSPAEERAMAYLGVVAGADGLMFFTHDTVRALQAVTDVGVLSVFHSKSFQRVWRCCMPECMGAQGA